MSILSFSALTGERSDYGSLCCAFTRCECGGQQSKGCECYACRPVSGWPATSYRADVQGRREEEVEGTAGSVHISENAPDEALAARKKCMAGGRTRTSGRTHAVGVVGTPPMQQEEGQRAECLLRAISPY